MNESHFEMDKVQPGRAKRFLTKLTLILFGLLVGAIIAELGLRVAGYSYPDFYKPDESRGYALRPGMEGWYRNEGEAYVRINSDGLRDREHSKAKPEGTLRIAVLGDSYAEALQVSAEEAFWAVMEKRLQGCHALDGLKVEALNFGVGGYGTAQELITIRERVWDYSPDLVLLTVTTSNDIPDNSLKLRQRMQTPYFHYSNGKLVLDDSYKTSRGFRLRVSTIGRVGGWIYDHSRVVQAVSQGSRGLRLLLASWKSRPAPDQKIPEKLHRPDVFSRSAELGTDNVVYLEPGDPAWSDAWRVTEGLIMAMRDEVRSRGARFVVVTLSNGPQVLPDPKARLGFMQRLGITDLLYPDNRIKSLADREGIPIVTLARDLQVFAEQNHVFLHGFGSDIGDGHWNEVGHRVAGEFIAQRLCEGIAAK